MCVGGLTTGKISVACLIYRLQSPTRWRTTLLIGICSLMCVINSVVIILMFTQCIRVQLLWDHSPTTPKGHCFNPNVVAIMSQSASSMLLSLHYSMFNKSMNINKLILNLGYMAFLDLALAAIPVHMIWNLQMHMKKKLAICGLLSTGLWHSGKY
jgi:hypothetical protein